MVSTNLVNKVVQNMKKYIYFTTILSLQVHIRCYLINITFVNDPVYVHTTMLVFCELCNDKEKKNAN